jgi:hypothetical protein
VLFSRNDIAQFINNCFEPVWESVRAVPIVRIDFGNGTVLTRTLHGNIATSICSADGKILDILPGVYQPEAYLAALDQLRMLPQYLKAKTPELSATKLREYHETQANALARTGAAGRLIDVSRMSKAKIESSIKLVLNPGAGAEDVRTVASNERPEPMSAEDLTSWTLLAEDTRVNETQRRRLIHEKLATASAVAPADVTKWMYKEVLHADLDDPYLGLGKVLFASYPFAKEDAH